MQDLTERARQRIGQTLRNKWHLDQLLGVGGMAAVYAGTHRNGRRGAVKVLHPELALDADTRRRFLKEGYVANAVKHPGAVEVLDDDTTEEGLVFLVMELLEGESVETLLERSGEPLDPLHAARIGRDLCEVLVAAHAAGIVHRDLKPDNLFITTSGQLKVLDFGIARIRQADADPKSATQTGNLMGTPAFMPPEQALGEWTLVDARSDIWAVGATLYNLLSGRCVHEAPTISKLLLAAMTMPPRPLANIAPRVPAELCAVVDRAIAFDRADRHQSAAELAAALSELIDDDALLAEPVDPLATTSVREPSEPRTSLATDATISASSLEAPANRTLPVAARVNETLSATTTAAAQGKPSRAVPVAVAAVALVVAAAGLIGWQMQDEQESAVDPAAAVGGGRAVVDVPTAEAPPPEPATTTEPPPEAEPATTTEPSASASAENTPPVTPPPVVPPPVARPAKPLPTPVAKPPPVVEPKPRGFEGRH